MSRGALALMLVAACACAGEDALPRGHVVIEGQRIEVEVAHTSETRGQGLSGRDGLAPGTGMLFIHPDAERRNYWMKEMRFAIDILWMHEGRIVDVSHRVRPPGPGEDGREIVVGPRVPADVVLELPAGYARAHGFARGQRVTIDIPDTVD